MTRDFTLSKYKALCKALISSSYRPITVQEYIQGQALVTRNFTLSKYETLSKAMISSSYRPITVREYIQGQVVEPFIILRYDVDRRPEIALGMAGMERDMGIRAKLFQDDPSQFKIEIFV